jgi:hypothetical protein
VSEARHIPLDSARLTVSAAYRMAGSIVAGTARHGLEHIATSLELESSAPREDVTALVGQAERMCFVLDAIQRPHEVPRAVTLNGLDLNSD